MPINSKNVDLLLQYALLIAGEEDDYIDQQLGPIHLIKYVYLADLFHARRKKGVTFTETDWQFYKFGPWSQAVNERIEPALAAINANKQSFSSDYENREDWVRWNYRNEYLLREKENALPTCIKLHLKREIHKFGKDTPNLLNFVYQTKPMLAAAPNEFLDFSLVVEEPINTSIDTPDLRFESLSVKKKKKFKEQMRCLQEKQKDKAAKKSKLINPVSNPRYDQVYEDGIAWLDKLAGQQITSGENIVEFSDECWHSNTRKDENVS